MKTFFRLTTTLVVALMLATCSNMLTELTPSADSQAATADKAALELVLSGPDTLALVTGSFALPTTGTNGSVIVWTSEKAIVLSGDGTVSRPAIGEANATVTLTATITKGGASTTKTFTVTVAAIAADATTAIAEDKASLVDAALKGSNADLANVKNALALRTTGPSGTTIVWSSNSAAISSTGAVTRPAAGGTAATVTLTATITKTGGTTVTKDFTAIVQPVSSDPTTAVAEDAAGLAGVTFKGANLDLNNVASNLVLPTTGPSGTTIAWTSDKTAISSTGVVTRPAEDAANETVTLTATVTLAGGTTVTKTFTVIVTAGAAVGGGTVTIASQPSKDLSFNTTGEVTNVAKLYKRLITGSDGALYAAWIDYGVSGATSLNFGVDKFNSDGSAVTTYGTSGTYSENATVLTGTTFDPAHSENVTGFAVDSTGAAYVGVTVQAGPTTYNRLVKVTVGGVLDTTFGTAGVLNVPASALLVDGSFLRTFGNSIPNWVVKKYSLAGVLDTTFATSGILDVNAAATAGLADSGSFQYLNGATLLKGSNGNYYLPYARLIGSDYASGVYGFGSNGATVTSFGTSGFAVLEAAQADTLSVTSAAFTPDGELVVLSLRTTGGFKLHKVNASSGAAVSAFTNTAVNYTGAKASALPGLFVDANAIFVGGVMSPGATQRPALWKFDTTSGAADTAFGTSGTYYPFGATDYGNLTAVVRTTGQLFITGWLSPTSGFITALK